MLQDTDRSGRFAPALASSKLSRASAVLGLTEDDLDFRTSRHGWIATDRAGARRCVEACVYGTLDVVGYPRSTAPGECIAVLTAYYAHLFFFQAEDGIRDVAVTGVQTCALPI